MSCRLLDLPHDLILQIADILLDEDRSLANNNAGQTPAADSIESENNATDLTLKRNGQVERLGRHRMEQKSEQKHANEVSKLGSSGEEVIINLSRTCTAFYKILSPYLFRAIWIRNSQKSSAAVDYLRSSNQSVHVKTLHFKASAPQENEEGFYDVEGIFPPGLDAVLSGLLQFPNLETLVIDFFNIIEAKVESHCENEEAFVTKEEQEVWKALVKKTFDAVSMNTSDTVHKLVVKDCLITRSSVVGSGRLKKVHSVIPLDVQSSPAFLLLRRIDHGIDF